MAMNLGGDRGEGYNPAKDQLANLRGERQDRKAMFTADYAVVERFDHERQTVDVRLLGDPASQAFRDIDVQGGGGTWRVTWNLHGRDKYPDSPDVGLLVFPRLDMSLHNLGSPKVKKGGSSFTHLPVKPLFFPGARVGDQAPNIAVTRGYIAEGDFAYNDAVTGAGLYVKADGSIDIRGDKVYFLGLTQTRANAQAVARQGDAGDGLGGAIAGGSTKVFSG